MKSKTKIAAVLAALLMGCLTGTAQAGNAPVPTPAGETPLPNIIYRVAYFANSGNFSSYPTTATAVVVTPLAGTCNYQVEWVSSSGVVVGYSGGADVHPLTKSFVFISNNTGAPPLPIVNDGLGVPYTWSNMSPGFFGYANVRTDCAANSKAMVAAYLSTYSSATGGTNVGGGSPTTIVAIPVTKKAGDNGE